MAQWKDLKLSNKLDQNAQEAAQGNATIALENAFLNDADGLTRFPGLSSFATLGGAGATYLTDWQGDMIAVSNGRTWRLSSSGTASEVTKVNVSGGKRVVFAKSPANLMMAAGGAPVRYSGESTELLSADAPPRTSHIAYVDGYTVANETDTGLFFHSAKDDETDWDPADVFAADSAPDHVIALLVTPFRELMIAGPESLEQFERITSDAAAFYRRWSVGEGLLEPHTLTFADNAVWLLNQQREFVRASGQVSQSVSDPIGLTLEEATDTSDAWSVWMTVRGQKFILLQLPNAATPYGTTGLTYVYDYRQRHWFELYGWSSQSNAPDRWPGWSYLNLWGRHFVGGNGKVLELGKTTYTNDGAVQRVLFRSGWYEFGETRIDDFRLRLKRGVVGSNASRPVVRFRVRRDNKDWSRWKAKDFGRSGESEQMVEFGGYGCCHLFQFEVDLTDACEFEFIRASVKLTPIGE